jgi:hypothetical protein
MKNSLVKRLAPIVAAGAVSLAALAGCPTPVPSPNPTPTPTPIQTPTEPAIVLYPGATEPNRINQVLIYDNSDNEIGFNLERKTENGNFVSLANLPANAELYNDSGVATSTQYTYRLRAYNNAGNSDWCQETTTSVGEKIGYKLVQTFADTNIKQ